MASTYVSTRTPRPPRRRGGSCHKLAVAAAAVAVLLGKALVLGENQGLADGSTHERRRLLVLRSWFELQRNRQNNVLRSNFASTSS